MAFIVECTICSQPWEVPQPLFTAPPKQYIILPEHEMLGWDDSKPKGIPCSGPQMPGIGVGERSDWERNWPIRRTGRPLPSVKDGSTSVQVLSLS